MGRSTRESSRNDNQSTTSTVVAANGPRSLPQQTDPTNAALKFEELLADLSAAFVRVRAEQIDDEIDRWLQRVVLALDLDRSSVAQLDPADGEPCVTHQWAREGVPTPDKGSKVARFARWLAEKILAGETVVISSTAKTPPEASDLVKHALLAGIKSAVTVPLRISGSVVGGVAFGSLREREWPPDQLRRLKLVAEVFGNALERKRTDQAMTRMREELRQVSSVAMMGELTASLAHELNQPLSAIRANAHAARRLLASETPDLHEVRDALDDIVRDDARAVETVQNVRALFQRKESEKSLVDPAAVLHEVERIVRHDAASNQVSLKFEISPSLPVVLGNRPQLIQVLINLILNAFDAVEAVPPGEREVLVSASQTEDQRVHVAVRDTGAGIDPKILPRLFDAFVTTKTNGIGMGLAIARTIIDNHGGELWAAPNIDRGTTLEFALPISASKSPG